MRQFPKSPAGIAGADHYPAECFFDVSHMTVLDVAAVAESVDFSTHLLRPDKGLSEPSRRIGHERICLTGNCGPDDSSLACIICDRLFQSSA